MSHNKKLVDGVPSKQHPLYKTWSGMRERCRYEKHKDYHLYGGRGINVCERWQTFEHFVSDVGERPTGKTLDRIDPNGDYCPENFKWSSAKEQANNQRPRKKGFKKGAYACSKTGVAGVYEMGNGRFRAVGFQNGKNVSLGCYATLEEAIFAKTQDDLMNAIKRKEK